LKAARDRFYKGDIAREMAKFSEENGGLFRYEDFATATPPKKSKPSAISNSIITAFSIYKHASASQGPARIGLR
jgi:gamma-glutamyltranspeptidase/glutathione hydrolase